MSILTISPSAVRFGIFDVELRSGITRKLGTRIRLQGQPLRILLMLLERPGEVVTREEMQRRLWPADTFVEFDHSLNTAVKKLRQALGDSAEQPLYIETVAGIGYRFIAPIEPIGEAGESPSASSAFAVAAAPARAGGVAGWLAAVLAAGFVGFVSYALVSSPPPPKVTEIKQITASDRADGWPELVTDGARTYFLEREGDHWNTMQTSAVGGEEMPVTVPFHNTRILDISPDKSEFLIASFTAEAGQLPLWTWPIQGGSPVRVGEITASNAVWSPNGGQITYARPGEIRIVNKDGSGDHLFLRTNGNPGNLKWSPDRSKLSYVVGNPINDDRTLWIANADGSGAHVRFPGWNERPGECCGVWTPDGEYFLFSARRDGAFSLWALREKRSFWHWSRPAPVQLTSAQTSMWGALPVAVGEGTHILAYGTGDERERLRFDLARRQFVPFLPAERGLGPEFSADGNWLVFQETPDGTLWRSKSDGTNRTQLVGARYESSQPRWSPDGKQIVFEAKMDGNQQKAYVVSAAGGPVQQVFQHTGVQGVPSWSPDGAKIALSLSNDAGAGIYVIDLATQNAVKLPRSENYTSPMWSPDGKVLIAKTYDQTKIVRFDEATADWKEIAVGTWFAGLSWSRDSKYVYFQEPLEAGQPIYRMRTADFTRERFLSFEELLKNGVQRCTLETLAPDGSPIMLISRSSRIYALDIEFP